MKSIIYNIYILSIILTLLLSEPSKASIVVTTIEGQELLLYENSYALVVGNSDYENFIRLPGAKDDAKEVAIALKRKGFNVELALNLTQEKFDTLFSDFAFNRGNKKNTRMLFYYAGHGATLPMAGDQTMGYLVMVDTPKPDRDRADFVTKSIDMQYMVTKSQQMLARHVLYMFDSCFSGTILNFRAEVKPQIINHRIQLPVRQFITAGSAEEKVPDKSYFKQVFLDLIEGRVEEPFKDGYITGQELGFYLSSQVPYYFEYQHPQFGKIKNPKLDKGDFLFLAGGVSIVEEIGIGTLEIETNMVLGMEINIYNSSGQHVYCGKGNAEVNDLVPGKYTVVARAPGYSEKIKSVFVNKYRKARVSFLLEELKGRIYVDGAPLDAQIRILNIRHMFKQGIALPPGRYELEVSHPDFVHMEKMVILNANEDLTVEMKLQRKPSSRQKNKRYVTNISAQSIKQKKTLPTNLECHLC